MPEFLNLLSPHLALERFIEALKPVFYRKYETIATIEACGRVCGMDVVAPHGLPTFSRSTVDGYAVRSQDTHGASESLPGYLKLAGEIKMGAGTELSLEAMQAALIHTGGMLPKNSDAVVMVENTQMVTELEIEIFRPVANGENTILEGEELSAGEVIIRAGDFLRPVEIGGLLAVGIREVKVYARPIVGIISTGDEVVPPDQSITIGQVRDINSYALANLVEENGGKAHLYGIIPDEAELVEKSVKKALAECDMVVITAGSSASARDITADVIQRSGKPGVLVHGISTKPGKPTILAICDGKPVIGLPGNPVSAFVIAMHYAIPALRCLEGREPVDFMASISAVLMVNLNSLAGREDWVPVRLAATSDGFQAEPIFAKSNMIFSLVRADGLIRIPPETTGISAGESVLVYPL